MEPVISVRSGFVEAVGRLDLEGSLSDSAQKIFDCCLPAINDSCTQLGGQSSQDDDSKRLWFASILFIAKSLRRDAAGGPGDLPGITLTKILESFGISLADFLKELPVLFNKAEPSVSKLLDPGVPLERRLRLRELQLSFVYITVLAKKCRELFQIYFKLPTTGRCSEPSVFHLVWQLFIVAKAKLFPPFPDLVASFNLLVCVLAFAFCHVPAEQRSVQITDSEKLPIRNEKGMVDVLESFGVVNKANMKELKPLMARLDTVLRSLLADFGTDKAGEENASHPEMDKMVLVSKYFPGVLSSGESLARAQDELNRTYEQMDSSVSEFDERPFVEARPAKEGLEGVRGTATPPSMTKCQVGTPVRSKSLGAGVPSTPLRLLPSPLRPANQHMLQTPSPVRLSASSFFATPGGPFPGTPVTEAMAAAGWLQDLSARSPSELTPEVKQFLDMAGPGVERSVAARVAQMADAVFPPQPEQDLVPLAVLNGALVSPRGAEGVKLYFRVLEGMLKAEQDRTGRSNFASLLASHSFHKCLAACAFEVVIASYRMVTHAFPAVLERLQLPAFDMSKLVGTFVRHISPAEQVPRELKRHLFSIEEKILEQQAWERGSSLYPLLASACAAPPVESGSPPAEPAAVMDESPPVTSRTKGGSTHSTPTKRRAEADLSTPTKAAKPAEGSGGPARAAAESAVAPSTADAGEEPCSPSRPDVPVEVAEAAAALVSASSGGLQSPRGGVVYKGLLSPRRKSDTSAFSAFMSPLRRPAAEQPGVPGALPAAFGRPGEGLERPGRAVVSDFLNKVLKLAALRISDICERLDFEPLDRDQIISQVYTMVSHVVSEHTNLLYGRHLDQIILCALYGVCKVNQLKQITFKDIITHYKKQAQAKNSIFRTVSIQLTPDLQVVKTGDVIEFYNAVFIPATKAFLLQLGNKTAQLAQLPTLSMPGTPLRLGTPLGPRSFSTPPAHDRLGAPGSFMGPSPALMGTPGGKVLVSPMRQSQGQQLFMGQRSHSMFSARMGESMAAYQSPSKDLSFINGRLQQRHPFRAGAPDAAPSSPAFVLQNLDPNSAVAHLPMVPPYANGGAVHSSERSTGSHGSDHPSASMGSRQSSEPSGSPAGRANRAGAANSRLLNLAAAAEQGRLANGGSTDSEESGGTMRGQQPMPSAAIAVRGTSQDS